MILKILTDTFSPPLSFQYKKFTGAVCYKTTVFRRWLGSLGPFSAVYRAPCRSAARLTWILYMVITGLLRLQHVLAYYTTVRYHEQQGHGVLPDVG